jgi:hypothetical protein
MTPKDIMDLTIPQLEYILSGCQKNSKAIEEEMHGGNTLKDKDAIQYLINSGEAKTS